MVSGFRGRMIRAYHYCRGLLLFGSARMGLFRVLLVENDNISACRRSPGFRGRSDMCGEEAQSKLSQPWIVRPPAILGLLLLGLPYITWIPWMEGYRLLPMSRTLLETRTRWK
jgi:hypothetical protein